ncbi:MAG TPA: hypothetical protein PKC65_12220 [Pyrinomonadaceae bacterium]|nr:hypothetical protein [Pyrinomonadaceae bacterium]
MPLSQHFRIYPPQRAKRDVAEAARSKDTLENDVAEAARSKDTLENDVAEAARSKGTCGHPRTKSEPPASAGGQLCQSRKRRRLGSYISKSKIPNPKSKIALGLPFGSAGWLACP